MGWLVGRGISGRKSEWRGHGFLCDGWGLGPAVRQVRRIWWVEFDSTGFRGETWVDSPGRASWEDFVLGALMSLGRGKIVRKAGRSGKMEARSQKGI